MKKIVIELELLSQVLPEAKMIPFLPRKKKKKLKKKILNKLFILAEEFVPKLKSKQDE